MDGWINDAQKETIRLKNGNIVKTSEYFNEDDPNFNYKLGQEVRIDWVDGWEWILPDE